MFVKLTSARVNVQISRKHGFQSFCLEVCFGFMKPYDTVEEAMKVVCVVQKQSREKKRY